MKKCSDCGGAIQEKDAVASNGVKYKYYSCGKCGDEIVSMRQLRDIVTAKNAM